MGQSKWNISKDKKDFYIVGNNKHDLIALTFGTDKEANAKLIVAAPEMKEAMQEFVDRCEKGEVRSTYTYTKFLTLLNKLK